MVMVFFTLSYVNGVSGGKPLYDNEQILHHFVVYWMKQRGFVEFEFILLDFAN